MDHSVDDWIAAFRESFDEVTAIPRDEWNLVDVYALSDDLLAVVVDQGPHRFGRRYRLDSLNGSGFRPLRHPRELAMILILGEILEPHTLESRPSSLATERKYPRAVWGGENPAKDEGESVN